MLCPACGTDTPAPFDTCRQCSTPLPWPTSSPGSEDETSVQSLVQGSRSADSSLHVGEMFGRYRILKLLGAGGMGQVYHAWDEELSEAVALKVIRSEFAGNTDADARFKRELSVARQVTHTNVVRIHDLGIIDGVRYISMPFIEGMDLAAMLSAGKLPQEVALSIARQLAAGLAAAHAGGVVNRDLKPANVMVDRSGHVFLMDFGLARSIEVTQLTQTGMLIGTVEYMSPEQALGQAADHRSDIYTLGLILFELFAGHRPFTGETPMSRLTARLHRPAPDPRTAHPDIPPYLSKIILRCLESDPLRRYQRLEDLIADLDAHQASMRPRPLLRARLGAVPHAAASRPRGSVAVALLLVAALAGGYGVWHREHRQAIRGGVHGAVAPSVSLVVLPFQNASGDPTLDWLGASLGEMLGSGVGQTASIRTASFGRVQQLMTDLHLAPASGLDAATVQRLAEFSNADTVVWGRYARVGGDQLRVEATIQDFKHGRTVPLPAVTASEKQVLGAVDNLAKAVQENVASSPDEVKQLRASAFRPSAGSIAALRSYEQGLAFSRQGDFQHAEAQLEAATKQDPKFALAYSQLGLTLAALGRDDEAERTSRRAVDLSDGLPDQERYRIRANQALVLHDNEKAREAYENLAKVSPDDPDIQFSLAGLYETMGEFDKARGAYARVLARDPKRVEALLGAGRVEVKSANPRAAIEPLNRALTLAIQLENDEAKGSILHTIGMAYRRLNKPDDALRYLQEALVERRQLDQKNGIAATIGQIAEVQRTLGKTNDAFASYNESLQLQRQIGDKRGLAVTLLNFASFLADRGQGDESLRMYKESLQIDRDLGDQSGEAVCLNNIGSVYLDQGRYDDALTYFQQALQLRQQLKVPGDVAETLHNVAECSAKMGQYDQALSQYMRALELNRTAGNKQGAAIESYSMGKIFELQGRYGAALSAKENAFSVYRAIGERGFWMAYIAGGYGKALAQIGRTAEADKTLGEAMSLARTLNNPAIIAQILNYQGESAFYAGDNRRARGLFEQALHEASRANDREQLLLSKFNVARVDVRDSRAAEAIPALKTIGNDADSAGLKYLSAESSVSLGEALLDRREFAQAKSALESAVARSEKMGLGAYLPLAHHLLGRAQQGLHEEAEAAHQFAEARSELDAIRKEAGNDGVLKRADFAMILQENQAEASRQARLGK